MLRFSSIFIFVLLFLRLGATQTWDHKKLLFENSLEGEYEDEYLKVSNRKGFYVTKGWRSSTYEESRLIISFKDRLPQIGSIEFTFTDFNPSKYVDKDSHTFLLLSSSWENPLDLSGEQSWINIRTSKNFVSGNTCYFRMDASPGGKDYQKQQLTSPDINYSTGREYTVKILYDYTHAVFYIDGKQQAEVNFNGQTQRFKYLYLAGDYKFSSVRGLHVSNLKVYTMQPDYSVFFLDKTHTKNAKGLDAPGYGGHGITVGDVNGDGRADMFIGNCVQGACLRNNLLIQQADGSFLDEAESRGFSDECCSHGVLFFDADNDGDLDLFTANTWAPNRLYINNGSGYFTDQSSSRGIENINGETRGAVIFDVNNDGWMDIFAVNWGMKNEMYINDGTGKFRREYRGAEGKEEDPEAVGTQGVTVADIDNDGDYDIYISKRDARNELYINENGYFREAAAERGVNIGRRSDGATFADFDNDGDMDLVVNNTRQSGQGNLTLYVLINDGHGYFTDKTQEYNLLMDGFSTVFADVDNDGDLDLYRLINNDYQTNVGGRLDLNVGGGKFASAGLCGPNVIGADARACAVYDFDDDGDLDFYITCKLFENIYLENLTPAQNNYLKVAAVGPQGDNGGIGSKVDIYESGRMGDPRYLLGHREITSVVGYLSGSGLEQHFGLGSQQTCDVRITFINGTVAEERGVAANQRIVLSPPKNYINLEKMSGDQQTGYVNQLLPLPLRVRVTDQDGRAVAGVNVMFDVEQGDAQFQPSPQIVTDTAGMASVNLRFGSDPGTVVVRGRVDGAKGSPVVFSLHAQVAGVLLSKVSGDGQTGTVGARLVQELVVRTESSTGGVSANASVTFSVVSGGGSIDGLATKTVTSDAQGLAKVFWTMGTITGLQTMTASVGGPVINFSATAVADKPQQMQAVGGAGQAVTPGEPFPSPFAVSVKDRFGNPTPNIGVLYQVTQGSGSIDGLSQKTVMTAVDGVASTRWTADPFLGAPNALQASLDVDGVPVLNSPVNWNYPAADVSATQSTVTATSPVLADGMSRSEVVVTLRNSSSQLVGAGYTVGLSVTGSDNQISYINQKTDANSMARAYVSSINPEQKIITAQVLGLNLSLSTRPVVEFESANQTPDKMHLISGNAQVGTVAAPLAEPFVIKVLDLAGRPMRNWDVQFVVVTGDGLFDDQSSRTVKTAGDGLATALLTLGKTAGMRTYVQVRAEGVNNSPLTLFADSRSGAARQLAIVSGNNQVGAPNTVLPQPIAVRVTDVYNNPVAGYAVQFRVNTGDCSIDGVSHKTIATDSSGLARITVKLGTALGQSIIAAITEFSSVSFIVTASDNRLVPDLQRSSLTCTSPVPADGFSRSEVVATLVDGGGRRVAGYGVRIAAVGEAVQVAQTDSLTDQEGQIRAYVTSTAVGVKIVLAYLMPENTVLEQRGLVEFRMGRPQLALVSGNLQIGVVGKPLPQPLRVRVSSEDYALAGQLVTFSVISGGGHFGGHTTATTDGEGIAEISYVLGTVAGENKVSANLSSQNQAVAFTLYGRPDVAAQVTKEDGDNQVGGLRAQLPQKLSIIARDVYNNSAPRTPITFEALDGGSIVTPQPVLTDSLGRAEAVAALSEREGRYTFKASLANGAMVLFSATAQNNNRAPVVISYEPGYGNVPFRYGDRLSFEITQVFDADNDVITYEWFLNGRLVGNQSKLALFMSSSFPPSNSVRCIVSDGLESVEVNWTLSLMTGVELHAFSAQAIKGQGVQLTWKATADDSRFNVHRSQKESGVYERVNRELVSARLSEYFFVDAENLAPGVYFYKLEAVDAGGSFWHGPISVTVAAPEQLALRQNYPNPFNPTTSILFELPVGGNVQLTIYNNNGQRVRQLLNQELAAGVHTSVWNAETDKGDKVPSGLYFITLVFDGQTQTRKLTLLK